MLMATFRQRDTTKTYSWDARLYNLTLTNTKVRSFTLLFSSFS
jgi:hypothetical protein